MINANIEDVYVEMPRDLESVDIAKQIISIFEKKIKKEKGSNEQSDNKVEDNKENSEHSNPEEEGANPF